MAVEEEEYDEEEKWVKSYSSNHEILLVGDGDFSFSLCLARSFGSASNIVATSLDPYDVVIRKYREGKSNCENLKKLGACLVHGVDATKMKTHPDLRMRKFDRIIFNFPHAGFRGKEDNALVIHHHRRLLHGFFWNASCMLRYNGEIHITHKTTAPFCFWDIEELASWNSLALVERIEFNIEDYPGYKHKRGDGSRCDQPFPLGECTTFKFWLSRKSNKMHRRHLCTSFDFNKSQMGHITMFNDMTYLPLQRLTSLDHIRGTNPNLENVGFPQTDPTVRNWEEEFRSFRQPLDQNSIEIHGRARSGVAPPSVHEMRIGFNISTILHHGNATRMSPEFVRRMCYNVGSSSHVNEYNRYVGFNKEIIMNHERSLNQDMHDLPQCNGRTRYFGHNSGDDLRLGFDKDMVSMHPQRNLNPEPGRSKALSLVRKFGNQEETFRNSGYLY